MLGCAARRAASADASALTLAAAGAQVLVHYGSGETDATAVVDEIRAPAVVNESGLTRPRFLPSTRPPTCFAGRR
ncbi:hypothetical protein DF036_22810 [Burkholderia contaminans]|nr:hypothetical protein DF036_22810 [Burkholderia contaminans]